MLITLLGLTAATLTTVCQIPQAIQIVKSNHARDISFPTYTILGLGVLLWFFYGILVKDIAIIFANFFTFLIVLFIWTLKIKYRNH